MVKQIITISVLTILYAVGAIGLSLGYEDWILPLTPFLMIISLLLILVFQQADSKWVWLVTGTLAVVMYIVELLGVHTKAIFGEYSYGMTLGFNILGAPPVIGINWMMLAFASRAAAAKLLKNKWVIALTAAVLMTLLDLLIEPMAPAMDMWYWAGGSPPVLNFVSWFLFAFGLQLCLNALKPKDNNSVAIFVYILQLLFFTVVHFTF